MTTTLNNVEVVGSPDYYLTELNGDGNAVMTSSAITSHKIDTTKTTFKFMLTKGNPLSDFNHLLEFQFDDGSSLSVFLNQGMLTYRYARYGNYWDSIVKNYTFELNVWYLLEITTSSGASHISTNLKNTNTDRGISSLTSISGLRNASNIENINLLVGTSLGNRIARTTKVADESSGDTLVDLSDIPWDGIIDSFGSTNAI